MEEIYFKRAMSAIIVLILAVLSFFLIKPILLSIIMGLLLAFLFMPIYRWTYKYVKSKNLSASLICVLFMLILIIPMWLLTPMIIDQSFKFYLAAQQMDFITPFKKIFPSLFASDQFSSEVGSVLRSFITKTTNSFMNSISQVILNFPTLALHFIVVIFTFFFALRDNERLIGYVKSLLPFPKEVEKKLFDSSKAITAAVIYGQVVIGVLQGIVAGIGFLIFGVPNALLLTLLAIIAGIFPIIGTTLVWLPVAIYLLIANNIGAATGVLIFGLVSSSIDNFLRPVFVSKRTKVHSSLILIGMIGGLFLFGILGIIIGPLILAYLLIIIELYRGKQEPKFLVNGLKG